MRKFGFLILLMAIAGQSFAIDGLLIKTIDYSFQEKWNNTLGASIPAISSCDKVFKKQYFFLTAIAADYSSNSQDLSEVQYSIQITKPDNSIYFKQEHLPLVKGKIINKNNLQMSDAILEVCFQDHDAFGKYKIEVEIIDRVSGKSKIINSDITLAPLLSYKQIQVKDDDAFSDWFLKYYENPKPEEAMAYYKYYAHSKLSENEAGFWPLFSFFLEIAKHNTYLWPQMIDDYENQDVKTKIYLLYLLTYSNIGTTDFFNGLVGDEKETYLKLNASPLTDFYGTIVDPSQLDMLWGNFTASGSYQPILKLIKTLDYTKYQGYIEKYKNSKQTDNDRQMAINNAIYNSLVWSLSSNCKQHKLVKEYCDWAFQYETLTVVQRDELNKILKRL